MSQGFAAPPGATLLFYSGMEIADLNFREEAPGLCWDEEETSKKAVRGDGFEGGNMFGGGGSRCAASATSPPGTPCSPESRDFPHDRRSRGEQGCHQGVGVAWGGVAPRLLGPRIRPFFKLKSL